MSRGQLALANHVQHRLGQRQQTQRVGHRRPALAQALGHLVLRQAALLHQPLHAHGLLDRVQVVALQVLDQRGLHPLHLVPVADDRGDLGQPGEARGAPAAFTRDDGISPAVFADQYGLNHAHRADGVGQLLHGLLVKAAAGLLPVGVDVAQAQGNHRVHRRALHFQQHRLLLCLRLGHLAQQRAQAAAQAL